VDEWSSHIRRERQRSKYGGPPEDIFILETVPPPGPDSRGIDKTQPQLTNITIPYIHDSWIKILNYSSCTRISLIQQNDHPLTSCNIRKQLEQSTEYLQRFVRILRGPPTPQRVSPEMTCPVARRYPLKLPASWKPPVPRWQLVFPSSIDTVHTLYVGIQRHDDDSSTVSAYDAAISQLYSHLATACAADAFITEVDSAHDIPGSRVWVAYYTSADAFHEAIDALNLRAKHRQFGDKIGYWYESFSTPISRLETNYAGLHEKSGLRAIPGIEVEGHEVSAYWGAARDRIPDSADDLFAIPGSKIPPDGMEGVEGAPGAASAGNIARQDGEDSTRGAGGPSSKPKGTNPPHITDHLSTQTDDPAVSFPPPEAIPRGLGQRLKGTNYDNMTHIRSGQCWASCPPEEASAYTRPKGLQEKLMKGMAYLWSHPQETGTLGLRWLRNVKAKPIALSGEKSSSDTEAQEVETINETCGAGFFRNLRDLEVWSSTHASHMAIFAGAHAHAREWGPDRKFMTWHEVSVLKAGEARWEYVNCHPRTGVVRYVKMDTVEEL
jgi:hypothetical protein